MIYVELSLVYFLVLYVNLSLINVDLPGIDVLAFKILDELSNPVILIDNRGRKALIHLYILVVFQ